MRKIIWGLAVALIFSGAFFIFREKISAPQYSSSGNILKNIGIKGKMIETEVVSSPEKLALGLSWRKSLCENCGMLFVFAKPDYHNFWMKDMNFDLDMLWILGDEVVYVARNVSHEKGKDETVAPGIQADKVLELNAGTVDELEIKEGDLIRF